MPIVMLLGGFLLLGLGAELLVRGASGLAIRLGVSPIVVGLTIVSLGTSAPELAVSIKSTLAGYSALALGNVVGSNIANIGLVLGVMALVSPIYIKRGSVMRDIPVAIGSFVLLLLLLLIDGELAFIDGLALTTGLVAFIIYCYMTDGKEGEVSPPEVVVPKLQVLTHPLAINKNTPLALMLFVIGGLALLVYGSQLFVDGAVAIARLLGVSEAVIGLTLVAVGTSVPEFATCLVAAWRGQPDIAVGNVIGSNIFNVLGILGITSLVGSISSVQFSLVDFGVALAFSLVLLPLARTDFKLTRLEGALLLAGYCAYLIYLLL
ncbi:MAG: calcium/sodium antiporter [Pseudomonadales bacterium]